MKLHTLLLSLALGLGNTALLAEPAAEPAEAAPAEASETADNQLSTEEAEYLAWAKGDLGVT
jgi:hypothetical protein